MARITDETPTNHDFISLQGAIVDPAAERIQIIDTPGIDGVAFRKIGKKPEPFTMIGSVDLDNAVNAIRDQINTYRGIVGDTCTIVDDVGNTVDNLKMIGARPREYFEMINAVGSGAVSTDKKYLLIMVFTFVATDTS